MDTSLRLVGPHCHKSKKRRTSVSTHAKGLGWYQYAANGWFPFRGKAADASAEAVFDHLSIFTQNVWFDAHCCLTRWEALLREIERLDPDVVCLQEVTELSMRTILADAHVQGHYLSCYDYDSFVAGPSRDRRYDVVMMVKAPFAGKLERHHLPSFLQRGFLKIELSLNGTKTAFGTVHLESTTGPKFVAKRSEQMEEIYEICEDFDQFWLAGDFNHCSHWKEEAGIIRRDITQDTWPALHPSDNGWTEDTEVNAMLREKQGVKKQVRFDRILFTQSDMKDRKNTGWNWVPRSVELVGREPLDRGVCPRHPDDRKTLEEDRLWISDHFGLYATYAIPALTPKCCIMG